jgi:hypothetical protein
MRRFFMLRDPGKPTSPPEDLEDHELGLSSDDLLEPSISLYKKNNINSSTHVLVLINLNGAARIIPPRRTLTLLSQIQQCAANDIINNKCPGLTTEGAVIASYRYAVQRRKGRQQCLPGEEGGFFEPATPPAPLLNQASPLAWHIYLKILVGVALSVGGALLIIFLGTPPAIGVGLSLISIGLFALGKGCQEMKNSSGGLRQLPRTTL